MYLNYEHVYVYVLFLTREGLPIHQRMNANGTSTK
jgi:hypothetical protein